MSHSINDLNELRELIRSTFKPVLVPKDQICSSSKERISCDPELQEIITFFDGKKWTQIQPSQLVKFHDSLPFLTNEAYHAFLPAYLMASLESTRASNPIASCTIYSLNALHYRINLNHEVERFQLFNPMQKATIKRFLEYLRDAGLGDSHDITKALKSYWEKS